MSTSTRSDEFQPLFEVLRTPTTACGDPSSNGGNKYLEFSGVSHSVIVSHDLCSPTSMNASSASLGCGMSTTKKKRPPSLFASTTAPPTGAGIASGSLALRTPLQSHCDPITRAQQQHQQQQSQQQALSSSAISPKVSSLVTSPKVPTRNCNSHTSVALSADRRTLFVGEYRVTKEGCTTLRNHLLLNPRGTGHMRLPDPSATPPLRSTLLEEPVSPISYSLDPLPPAAAAVSHAGAAAMPAMPSPPSERLISPSPPLQFTLADRPPPLTAEAVASNPISPELASCSSSEFSPASVHKHTSANHHHNSQQQHHQHQQSSQFLPPAQQQKQLGHLAGVYTTPQSFGNISFSSPFHSGGGQPLRYQDLVISSVPFESGASASVYVAHHLHRTNKRFAVKRIPLGSLFPELNDGPHALLNAPSVNGSFAGGGQSLGFAATSGETFTDSPLEQLPGVAQGAGPSLSPSELTPQHSASAGGAYQFAISALPRHRQLHSILLRELRMLHSEYRSAHVVKVYNAFFIPETASLDIVMEFMEFGSLDMLGRQLSSSDFGISDEQQSKMSSSHGATASLQSNSSSSSSTVSARSSASRNDGRHDDGEECNDEREGVLPPGDVNTSQSSQDYKSRAEEHQRLKVPLPERVLAVIAEQLLRGISDMHSRGHIHRDIKPQNVLVNRYGVVKLSDFGLLETVVPDSGTTPHSAVMMDDPYAPLCSGTDKYMSPERHRGEPHGKPSDIWAFGVTLAECALGRYPASLESSVDQFDRMDRMRKICFRDAIAETIQMRHSLTASLLLHPGLGADEGMMSATSACPCDVQQEGSGGAPSFTQSPGNEADLATLGNLSASCVEFIQLCLAEDPARRPTALELLESHPFLSQWKDTFDFAACIARIHRRESTRRGHRSRPKRRREVKQGEVHETNSQQAPLSGYDATCSVLHSTCTPTTCSPRTLDVEGLKALEEATAKMVS